MTSRRGGCEQGQLRPRGWEHAPLRLPPHPRAPHAHAPATASPQARTARASKCKLARDLSAISSACTRLLAPSPSPPAPISPSWYLLSPGLVQAPGGAASSERMAGAVSVALAPADAGLRGAGRPGSEYKARGGLPSRAEPSRRAPGLAHRLTRRRLLRHAPSSAIGSSPRLHPGGLGLPAWPPPRPPGCSQS